MKNSAREEARVKGNRTYSAVVPCIYGHEAKRYTLSGDCVACAKASAAKWNKNKKDTDPTYRKTLSNYQIARNRRAKANDPDGYKAIQKIKGRKYKSGMTEEQYQYFLVSQGNRCALCLCTFSETRKAYADHCHDTQKVRGLLCRECNLAEGLVKKTGVNPQVWAERLSKYLRS